MTEDLQALRAPLAGVVGGKTAAALARALDLHTVRDLLDHFPRRYQERGELTDLRALRLGEHVTVQARVMRIASRRLRPRLYKTDVVVGDGTERLGLTFFNQPWREKELQVGRTALFAGKVEQFQGKRQLTNPEVQVLDEDIAATDAGVPGGAGFAGAVVPIYPAAAKVPSWVVARCVHLVLDALGPLPDPLPPQVRRRHGLLPLREAYEAMHRPADFGQVARGRRRLAFDEAFFVQTALAQRRLQMQATPAVPRPARDDGLRGAFDATLPFTLTEGQREVGEVIDGELARSHPMYRLLQGEVGSGKTMVAVRAMLAVVDAGGQAALLAPTEVLATQHARSIRQLLGPLGRGGELDAAPLPPGVTPTRVALLTGSMPAAARRAALAEIAGGDAGIVIGTHALLSSDIAFHDLGLVVVDEQHRFGVEQRDALRTRGEQPPHVLVMTATPIPRTVAMTVFGDLEVSTLTQLPSGRQPVASHVVPADRPEWVARMWERIRDEVALGYQAFVVCPRIAADDPPSDDLAADGLPSDDPLPGETTAGDLSAGDPAASLRPPAAAVEQIVAMLDGGPLRGLRLAALHGRQPAEERSTVMNAFAGAGLDVLVATTVVEVGVDVPNATVIVILDADRFGVSQLHQLRGRVGRGSAASVCLLHTTAAEDTPAYERVAGVAATSDGAQLALLDLAQRREGDVLGVSQSGRRRALRLLSLLRDSDLITTARQDAGELVAADPGLEGMPVLAAMMRELVDEERSAYLEKA